MSLRSREPTSATCTPVKQELCNRLTPGHAHCEQHDLGPESLS